MSTPPLHHPSSPLSWSRIGLLGRGGCVIVFPANVCKSASAGARAASVPFDWCSVTWEMTGAWQSGFLWKSLPRKRRRRRRKQTWWLSVVLCWSSVIPAFSRWTSLSSRQGELLLLRLHVASPPRALLLDNRRTFVMDVYIHFFFFYIHEIWLRRLGAKSELPLKDT